MPGLITCPKCNYQFQPTDAFRQEVQRELNNKAKRMADKKGRRIPPKRFGEKDGIYVCTLWK